MSDKAIRSWCYDDNNQNFEYVAVEEAEKLEARLETLEETVAKLPKCWRLTDEGELVQDVPVVPGMVLWYWIEEPTKYLLGSTKLHIHYTESFLTEMDGWKHFCDCYSTREAAKAKEPTHA